MLLLAAASTVTRVLQRQGGRAAKEDLDDIRSTVNVRLVRRLREPAANPIGNLTEYVAGITYNAYYDFLRQRYPERMRIKGRIRYVLGHDRRFAMWESQSGIAAGLVAWRGREPRREPVALQAVTAPPMSDPQRTAKTLALLFERADAPLLLDDVVSFFMSLWNVSETAPGQPREAAAPESSGPQAQFESRQFLSRLWREIRELPAPQRAALLLNLRDADGRNALTQLLLAGIASAADIAAALEMSPQRLREIWNDLPLDDLRIAGLLGRTRQQVINLRKAARDRLSRRMQFERRRS